MLTLWNNHVHRFFLHRLQLSRPHSRFSVRSALTDAPVASFTTSFLRITQHATGLMVKVAPLLPSRDLLSSHSQLDWTHTLGLLQGWLDIGAMVILSLLCFIWAGRTLLGFCLLTCTFISLISSGSGRTSNEFQPCSKPCPLWAIQTRRLLKRIFTDIYG